MKYEKERELLYTNLAQSANRMFARPLEWSERQGFIIHSLLRQWHTACLEYSACGHACEHHPAASRHLYGGLQDPLFV